MGPVLPRSGQASVVQGSREGCWGVCSTGREQSEGDAFEKQLLWFVLLCTGQNIKQEVPGSGSECQDLSPVFWTLVALDTFLGP